MRFPDDDPLDPRLPRPVARAIRSASRLARTPMERFMLLLLGGVVAFFAGRYTSNLEEPAKREMPATIRGIPLVLDGDTIDFDGKRVRIFGIDSPERDQVCEREDGSSYSCGHIAREALVGAIERQPVTCSRRDVDVYGRMVAVCVGKYGDVGKKLVREGHALAYRQYSHDYVNEENEARKEKLGLWAGRFDAPWDYRQKKRGPAPPSH